MAAHKGKLLRTLALDGKWVRDRLPNVGLSEPESGAPVVICYAGGPPRKTRG